MAENGVERTVLPNGLTVRLGAISGDAVDHYWRMGARGVDARAARRDGCFAHARASCSRTRNRSAKENCVGARIARGIARRVHGARRHTCFRARARRASAAGCRCDCRSRVPAGGAFRRLESSARLCSKKSRWLKILPTTSCSNCTTKRCGDRIRTATRFSARATRVVDEDRHRSRAACACVSPVAGRDCGKQVFGTPICWPSWNAVVGTTFQPAIRSSSKWRSPLQHL